MTTRRTAWMLVLGILLLMFLDLVVFSSLRRVDTDSGADPPRHDATPRVGPQSRADFLSAQQRAGWVAIGYFGEHWPATEVRRHEDTGSLRFSRADGTPHEYVGFDGYRLRVMFLEDARGRETVVVLRSQDGEPAPRLEIEPDTRRR